jgi:NodT family efflux transporter outer membrane factor (OMF) lipoprotein
MNDSARNKRSPSWETWLVYCCLAAAALAQNGCTTSLGEWYHNGFKVGPNYHEPPAPLSHEWIDSLNPLVQHGDPNIVAWWDVFQDPILTDLLHRSYANNLTLRAAGFQIMQAQQQRAIAIGELLPQSQGYTFQYTRVEASANQGAAVGLASTAGGALSPTATLSPVALSPTTPIAGATTTTPSGTTSPSSPTTTTPTTAGTTTTTPTNPTVGSSLGPPVTSPGVSAGSNRFFTNIATSLNLSWEIDFWGLFRRNLESATGSLDQSVDNFDQALVLLLANVATQYVEIRTLQKRLMLAERNVALQEPLVKQYEERYKAGVANSYPGYFQLKSNLENTKALIPQLRILLRQASNQLCVLLGEPVHDLLPQLGDGSIPDPADPKEKTVRIPRPCDERVVLGIPGEMLLLRPDVMAAERQLAIQSAEIGIAEAELYPHIGINGSIGLAANKFGKLFNTRSWTGSIGPTLTWNILNYGRLLANVRLQNLQFQQFVAQYQNTVLNANLDAENALVGYLQSLDQSDHLSQSADAAAKLSTYLIRQFKAGYLPPGAVDTSAFINQIFTAVNFQVTQQDAAAQAEGNIALNLIFLYRALGGGWQIRLEDGPNRCPSDPGLLPGDAAPAVPFSEVPTTPEALPAPRPLPPDAEEKRR